MDAEEARYIKNRLLNEVGLYFAVTERYRLFLMSALRGAWDGDGNLVDTSGLDTERASELIEESRSLHARVVMLAPSPVDKAADACADKSSQLWQAIFNGRDEYKAALDALDVENQVLRQITREYVLGE
ncbi:hypothetical protein [Aeromicrobium sp. MLTX1]|uniref:hypothetical protein n=1 Tax=Aeromicrobium sp. MLTX1 TaxID=3389799 RepID=UPI00396B336A